MRNETRLTLNNGVLQISTLAQAKQCVILVGGPGTRLGELVRDIPKPMLKVADRPFLEYLIDNAARFGFSDFVLLAGYEGQVIAEWFAQQAKEKRRHNYQVRTLIEPARLGTGGALHLAAPYLHEEFMLMNGDSIFDINLLDAPARKPDEPWLGKICLREINDAQRYGTVELAGERIRKFAERPESGGPGLINGGIYWLRRAILDKVSSTACSLEADVFPGLAQRGLLAGYRYRGNFIDIGIPEDFNAAADFLSETLRRPAVFFDQPDLLTGDKGEEVKRINDAGIFVFLCRDAGTVPSDSRAASLVELNAELAASGAHVDDIFSYDQLAETSNDAPNNGLSNWDIDFARSFAVCDDASIAEHFQHLNVAAAIGDHEGLLDRILSTNQSSPL